MAAMTPQEIENIAVTTRHTITAVEKLCQAMPAQHRTFEKILMICRHASVKPGSLYKFIEEMEFAEAKSKQNLSKTRSGNNSTTFTVRLPDFV